MKQHRASSTSRSRFIRRLRCSKASRPFQNDLPTQAQIDDIVRERDLLKTLILQLPVGILLAEAPSGKTILMNDTITRGEGHPFFKANQFFDYRSWKGRRNDGSDINNLDWPLVRALTRGETTANEEIHIDRGDGRISIERVSAIPLKDQVGAVKAAVSVFCDISDMRLNAEANEYARLVADDANKAKSAFLANMSHEIRTPISIVLGFVDILLSQENMPAEERRDQLSIIDRNCRHLLRIIDDILDISKVEAGKVTVEKRRISLMELLSDLQVRFSKLAQEKQLTLSISAQKPLPQTIESDVTRLRQILDNLIANAIKFTAEGHVSVTVDWSTNVHDTTILNFIISDTGIGLTEEQKNKLFQPFVQADPSTKRRFGGTGMGLYLSRKLAEALEGKLHILKTAPNVGSTFELSLNAGTLDERFFDLNQISTVLSTPIARSSPPLISELAGMIILVADDALDNQFLIRTMLEREGAMVEVAENGLEALDKARLNSPDFIIMDVQMPGMDGLEATTELRRRGDHTPVVALTAHAMKDVRDRCFEAGCNGQLTKPVRQRDLIDTICIHRRKIDSNSKTIH